MTFDRVLYPQWRDQFDDTKYPFSDRATLCNTAGCTLLEGTFIDAHLYPIGGKEKLYLSKVIVEHENVTLWIGDIYTTELAQASYLTSHFPSTLRFYDKYHRPAGVVISSPERLAVFQTWGIGQHEFKPHQTEFAATCCMPTPEIGVRGIILEDGSLFVGSVWIVGSDGVVLRGEEVSPPLSGYAIHVDVVGDPLFRRRLCSNQSGNLFTTPRFICKLRIRDNYHYREGFECSPNEFGAFTIYVNNNMASDTALRLRVTEKGLVCDVAGSKITEIPNA